METRQQTGYFTLSWSACWLRRVNWHEAIKPNITPLSILLSPQKHTLGIHPTQDEHPSGRDLTLDE